MNSGNGLTGLINLVNTFILIHTKILSNIEEFNEYKFFKKF